MGKVYKVTGRKGPLIHFQEINFPGRLCNKEHHSLDLSNYGYAKIRKGFLITFDNKAIDPSNLVYLLNGARTTLFKLGGEKDQTHMHTCEVIKRTGSVVQYRLLSRPTETLTLDLDGYVYKPFRKGIFFVYLPSVTAIADIVYYPCRGAKPVKIVKQTSKN